MALSSTTYSNRRQSSSPHCFKYTEPLKRVEFSRHVDLHLNMKKRFIPTVLIVLTMSSVAFANSAQENRGRTALDPIKNSLRAQ